jgi:hypothetical protein
MNIFGEKIFRYGRRGRNPEIEGIDYLEFPIQEYDNDNKNEKHSTFCSAKFSRFS